MVGMELIQDTGNPLLMNTYIYEINYKDFEGWKHQDFWNNIF